MVRLVSKAVAKGFGAVAGNSWTAAPRREKKVEGGKFEFAGRSEVQRRAFFGGGFLLVALFFLDCLLFLLFCLVFFIFLFFFLGGGVVVFFFFLNAAREVGWLFMFNRSGWLVTRRFLPDVRAKVQILLTFQAVSC